MKAKPTYAVRLALELEQLRQRHGVHYRGGEDAGLYCDRKLSNGVALRMAKLARLIDLANHGKAEPLICYDAVSRPVYRSSMRVMSRWFAKIDKVDLEYKAWREAYDRLRASGMF